MEWFTSTYLVTYNKTLRKETMSENTVPKNANPVWYQLTAAEVMQLLGAERSGLSSGEAGARLAKYGYNEIRFKKRGALARFLLQFNSPLVYVLLAAAAVTAFLEMWIDSSVIFVVVLANTIIGFIQEGKAEASMEALTRMMVPACTVLRDGKQQEIPARELVPGDVVLLEEGDRVPADLRLYFTRNLSTDEAALTGESVPAEKQSEPIPRPNLPPGDQRCMVFSGTFTTRGSARGIVVATGEQTEIGKIARLMKETPRVVASPLMRKIAQFTKFLIIVILALAVLNLLLGVFLGGYDLLYSFLASVSLAVAAIPEGLPAIVTIALALGAKAMGQRNALVRRLPAVETLGSATVICSDKTGTLTKGEMTVVEIFCGNRTYAVSGVGYDPRGEFTLDNRTVDVASDPDLSQILKTGLLCNSAAVEDTGDGYKLSGDPTEGALVVAGLKGGFSADPNRLDEIPFDSQSRYMVTLNKKSNGNVIHLKGSPERILEMCRGQLVDGSVEPLTKEELLSRISDMTKQALRVLGLAYKEVPAGKTSLTQDDLKEMVFLGFQGMIDPPREEAIDAVAKCKKAGIRVLMVTGDHPQTAEAIAGQLGIDTGAGVLTGEDLTRMTDEELYAVVDRVSIFARVAPAHKFRVATQLQKRGHIVAVTGDGVNDAPALKAADLGIAMGVKGTDVAKEAADMILVDDNFASIVAAVEEGRHTFENIRKVILYTLPTNGGQALLVVGAIIMIPFVPLFAERLPLEPIQILWINLYDAVALALPLLWEPRESALLDRPPRDPSEPLANSLFFRKVGLVSLVMAASAFFVFYHFGIPAIVDSQVDEELLMQAQTAAFMTVMIIHVFYLLTARSLTLSVFRMSPFSNRRVLWGIGTTLVLHLLIVYVLAPLGFNPFRVAAFPAHWWFVIIPFGMLGLFLTELEEFFVDHFRKDAGRQNVISKT